MGAPAAALARETGDDAHFVFVDLETTGLSPRSDHIIELAAVRVGPGGAVGRSFHALVRIPEAVPPFITTLTGITDAMLRDQEPIERTFPRFLDFIEDLPLVAYNVSFDMGFLTATAQRLQRRLQNIPVCALQVARRKLPGLPNHKLATVAAHLGVRGGQNHRALEDCRMALDVFVQLMRA
jgi:DNA polymerase III epsilon subunit family exonuclease